MEFGALIPLWYMSMCCLFTTPLIGIGLLVFIRFSKKDVKLSKIVLATVLIICFIWFIFPFGQLLYSYFHICTKHPECAFDITNEMFILTLRHATYLALLPGSSSGFLFAYIIVVPTTHFIRKRKKKKEKSQLTG